MVVRPIITYGCITWVSRTNTEVVRKSLSKIQRLACVCITGGMKSCPTAAMEVILNLPPLHVAVETTAELVTIRIANGDLKRSRTSMARDSVVMSSCPYALDVPKDKTQPKFFFEKRFCVTISNKKEFCLSTLNPKQHSIKWYTDGSKTSTGTGAGIVGPGVRHYEALGREATVYQAELYALDKCLQINLERKYLSRNIIIHSDSQAALKAISAYSTSSKLVEECRSKLDRLSEGNKVNLTWIPGHAGIAGNEMADALAKKGSASPFVGPEPFFGAGETLGKRLIRMKEAQKSSDYWKALPGLRQAKMLLGNYQGKRAKICRELERKQLRILTGFLTGHCNLNGHLTTIGVKQSNNCRFCQQENEDPRHILIDCEAIARRRAECLGQLQLTEEDLPSLNPHRILQLINVTGLGEVL